MSKQDWQGAVLTGWSVHEWLGSGGNGVVHRATRGEQEGAIKILKPDLWTGKRYQRFKDEIEGMKRCKGIPGVIPLLDSRAPYEPKKTDPPWIVMVLAERLTDALSKSASLVQVVQACLEIAEALSTMHARGLSHRDIKPENLFRVQGRSVVGDLGLIDYEGKCPVTAEGEKLGPAFYIAPEMLNNSDTANGQCSDVYSFAKTLWVLATGQRFPLPGEMKKTVPALTISQYVQDSRASLLDPVIEAATSFDPAKRPAMEVVAHELRAWLCPTTPMHNAEDLDLSRYASEIEGINARHYVREEQIREEHEIVKREGFRVREMFRPLVQSVHAAIQNAKFVNTRSFIDNQIWGYTVRGHVLATAWLGEVELKLDGSIYVKLDGMITVESHYVAQVNEDGKTTDWELWKGMVSFLSGGSQECQEIERLVADIRAELPKSVDRILRMSKGEEGAPPRNPGK